MMRRSDERKRFSLSTPPLGTLVRLVRSVTAPGNFAMFHVGRSGSRVLADLLQQHPRIQCDGEILRGPYRLTPAIAAGEKQLREPRDPASVIRSRIPSAGFSRFYGFEMKFFHLRFNDSTIERFVEDAVRLGVTHFVVLERRNTLRKVVSSLLARQRGRFHFREGESPPPATLSIDVERVDIDNEVKPLIAFLESFARDFRVLRKELESRRSLWLTYEDNVERDPVQGAHRVCDFLGLDRHHPSVDYVRTTPRALRTLISNYHELAEALGGTPFEWMLEE